MYWAFTHLHDIIPTWGTAGCATEPELPGWEDQKNSIATSNVCLYTVVVHRRTSKDKYAASYPNSPIQSLQAVEAAAILYTTPTIH